MTMPLATIFNSFINGLPFIIKSEFEALYNVQFTCSEMRHFISITTTFKHGLGSVIVSASATLWEIKQLHWRLYLQSGRCYNYTDVNRPQSRLLL